MKQCRLTLTLKRFHLVQVTVIACSRTSASQLHSGSVITSYGDPTIDEVESATLHVICDLKTSLNELLVRMTVCGYYSQYVHSRSQGGEDNMTTGTCSITYIFISWEAIR